MHEPGMVLDMPPKKQSIRKGRPPEPEPIRALASIKGTRAFEDWLDELVEHTHQGTRALLLKNAIREYAENHGFKKSRPDR